MGNLHTRDFFWGGGGGGEGGREGGREGMVSQLCLSLLTAFHSPIRFTILTLMARPRSCLG